MQPAPDDDEKVTAAPKSVGSPAHERARHAHRQAAEAREHAVGLHRDAHAAAARAEAIRLRHTADRGPATVGVTAMFLTDEAGYACGADTTFTATDSSALAALAELMEPVQRLLVCELAAGHDGSHAACAGAAHGGDQWWWLRWRGQVRELAQIDPCVDQIDAPDPESCLLPHGHPGPHSYELHPPLNTTIV